MRVSPEQMKKEDGYVAFGQKHHPGRSIPVLMVFFVCFINN
jgi:hypothetical protein